MIKTFGRKSQDRMQVAGSPEFVDVTVESLNLLPPKERRIAQQYVPKIAESYHHSRIVYPGSQEQERAYTVEKTTVPTFYQKLYQWYNTPENMKYHAAIIMHETQHSIDLTTEVRKLSQRDMHKKYAVTKNNPHVHELERRAVKRQIQSLISMNAPPYLVDHLRCIKDFSWNDIPLEQM